MSNSFGGDLNNYALDKSSCIKLLSKYLNQGNLGLMLGAGASKALKLPDWESLVLGLCTKVDKTLITKTSGYSSDELKDLAQKVKDKIKDEAIYIATVKELLYNGVNFDINTARKELLIALSSLIVGKKRGNVQDIITYNFDSLLEWYLYICGLNVNVITKHDLLIRSCDVNISHVHGYLPFDENLGNNSSLVFTSQDFEDRMVTNFEYWKEHLNEFWRRHFFLTIGLSPSSILKDICPHLRELNKWYASQNLERFYAYGVAVLTPGTESNEAVEKLIQHGIIPLIEAKENIPNMVFEIAQTALKVNH